MPIWSSIAGRVGFDPRVPVLVGTILLVGALGESGTGWKACGTGTMPGAATGTGFDIGALGLVAGCGIGTDALPGLPVLPALGDLPTLPELLRAETTETDNG